MPSPLLIALACSLLALIPLVQPHFFASSDGLYHIHRAIELGECLRDGVVFCRWAPNQFLGYGTPLFNFYSPLIYYVTNGFRGLGLDWVGATRGMMAVFMLASAGAAYLYSRRFLSAWGALVAAVAYVFVPYHLVNAYYRGDLPEFAAMAFFPAILWAYGELSRPITHRGRWVFLVLSAVMYGGLVLTHNLSAFLFTGLLIPYCIWLLVTARLEGGYGSILQLWSPAARLVGATVLGVGLSAFLVFPALLEKGQVTLEGLLYVSHQDHFPTLEDILPNSLVHAYAPVFPGADVYGYKLGLSQLALGGLGLLAALVFHRRTSGRARGEAIASLGAFGLGFFFTLPASLPLWDNIPLLPHAQFPWRFLLLLALPTSLLTGYLVEAARPGWRGWVAAPLLAAVVLPNLLGLRPVMATARDSEVDLVSSIEFELLYHLMGTTVAGEYIPRSVKDRPWTSPAALAMVLGGEAPPVHPTASDPKVKVEQLERRSTERTYRVLASEHGRVVFNVAYFAGWHATLDGEPIPAVPNEPQGLLTVYVPPGDHIVRVQLGQTAVRAWAETLTVVSLGLTLSILLLALKGRGIGTSLVRTGPRNVARGGWSNRLPGPRQLARLGAPLIAGFIGLALGGQLFAWAYQPPRVAEHPLKLDLDNGIRLLGYDLLLDKRPLGFRELIPGGSTLDLRLAWWTPPGLERADEAKLYARLTNIDEQQWSYAIEAERIEEETGITRSHFRLPVPGGMPPGVYQIDLGALGRSGKPASVRRMELVELLPTQGSARIGPLHVRGGPQQPEPLRFFSGMSFEEAVVLESFDLMQGATERRPFPQAIPAAGDAVRAATGEPLQLDLLWRALRSAPGHLTVAAVLSDDQGFRWAYREAETADGMYPAWFWTAGTVLRDQLRLPISPDTPPGRYRLDLRLLDRGRPLAMSGAGQQPHQQGHLTEVELVRGQVQARDRDINGMTHRERVRLNEDLEIIAMNLDDQEVRAGQSLDLALAWRAPRDPRRDYRVRLSLVGQGNQVLGQSAIVRPAGSLNPVDRWEARDIYRGQYRLTVALESRASSAKLLVELLDEAGGQVLDSKVLTDLRIIE